MSVVDLLVTIVVVTILVTVVLAVVTYVAYKLRLSREPAALDTGEGEEFRYFVRHEADTGGGSGAPGATRGAGPSSAGERRDAPEA